MSAPLADLCWIAGSFYRVIGADRVHQVLEPPVTASAGRYHRPGEPALYLSREADWAVIAMGTHVAGDRRARVVVPLQLDGAWVFDQRDSGLLERHGLTLADAMEPWLPALAEGLDPPSWCHAARARTIGAQGITDPSRGIVGGWHLALFCWNKPGSPQVRVAGDPLLFDYTAARARWPAPSGWRPGGR